MTTIRNKLRANIEIGPLNVEDVFDEVDRRMEVEMKEGGFAGCTQDEVNEYYNAMLQGVYSVLIVLAKDWPAVARMCDSEEERRRWKRLGYPED